MLMRYYQREWIAHVGGWLRLSQGQDPMEQKIRAHTSLDRH